MHDTKRLHNYFDRSLFPKDNYLKIAKNRNIPSYVLDLLFDALCGYDIDILTAIVGNIKATSGTISNILYFVTSHLEKELYKTLRTDDYEQELYFRDLVSKATFFFRNIAFHRNTSIVDLEEILENIDYGLCLKYSEHEEVVNKIKSRISNRKFDSEMCKLESSTFPSPISYLWTNMGNILWDRTNRLSSYY